MNYQAAYIFEGGDESIYSSPDVLKATGNPGALEAPIFEDIRGKIQRVNFQGVKFNIIETKKGFMRGGDLHQNTQFNMLYSGRVEVWTLVGDKTEKTIIEPNQFIVIKPNLPHLFNFLEDTVQIEWWEGPYDGWLYKPYRKIIEQS